MVDACAVAKPNLAARDALVKTHASIAMEATARSQVEAAEAAAKSAVQALSQQAAGAVASAGGENLMLDASSLTVAQLQVRATILPPRRPAHNRTFSRGILKA